MNTASVDFRRNRLGTFSLKRCDIALIFPGETWTNPKGGHPLLHVDNIQPTYNRTVRKTRGMSSNDYRGLNYLENDEPNMYAITVVGLNDRIKDLLNYAQQFQLDIGLRAMDRLSGLGFQFEYCSVRDKIGRGSLAVGRDSLLYTINLETYEEEKLTQVDTWTNENADFDGEEPAIRQPSEIFPNVNDILGI